LRRWLSTLRAAPGYHAAATQVLATASFPFEKALSALEESGIPGVQVATLDIDAQAETARAELEVLSPALLDQFMTQLYQRDGRTEWTVAKIREAQAVPLPAGAPGPLPTGLLPPSRTAPLPPRRDAAVMLVILEWGATTAPSEKKNRAETPQVQPTGKN
jgi:hypothetical protein